MRAFLLMASVVLVAIAIGVVAEAPVADVIGPAGARFTAAFPGTPRELQLGGRSRIPVNAAGAPNRAPILSYLRGAPSSDHDVASYGASAHGRALTVSLVTAPALVPDPAAVDTARLTPVRSGWLAGPNGERLWPPTRLVERPTTLDGKQALIGVVCVRRARHATTCIGTLSGMQSATTHRLTSWTALATAGTAPAVLALLRSLRPLGS